MAGKIVFGSLRNHLIGTGVIMTGWAVGCYVPNTIGVKIAKRLIETVSPYCKSISAEPETEILLNEVIKDINAHQDKPVNLDGIEFLQLNAKHPVLIHKGKSSTGAIIGLPIGTRYNADDVFHYHFPDTVSEKMANYCILTPEAIKFILAREIFYVEDNYIMFRVLAGLGMTAVGSLVHYVWNSVQDNLRQIKLRIALFDSERKKNIEEIKNLFKLKAHYHRVFTFFVIGYVCYQIYQLIDIDYNWRLEKEADEKVAKLGPVYQRGGFEYYLKLTQLNKFLRSQLLQRKDVDEEGNYIQSKYLVFQKHVPLTFRYKYFSSLLPEDDLSESE